MHSVNRVWHGNETPVSRLLDVVLTVEVATDGVVHPGQNLREDLQAQARAVDGVVACRGKEGDLIGGSKHTCVVHALCAVH